MFFQYFDAELEIRLLKMTCDVLKDTGSKLVIFDDVNLLIIPTVSVFF